MIKLKCWVKDNLVEDGIIRRMINNNSVRDI